MDDWCDADETKDGFATAEIRAREQRFYNIGKLTSTSTSNCTLIYLKVTAMD